MRKLLHSTLAIAASVLLAFSMSAAAQGVGSPGNANKKETKANNRAGTAAEHSAQSSTKPDKADEGFLKKAAQAGKLQVELAPIAERNASSPEVKDFAKRMMTDHMKADAKLQALATKEDVVIPDQPSIAQRAKIAELKKLSGPRFDKAYMAYMVKDHTHDVSQFKTEAYSAKAPAVRDWASDTLPTLESHLKEAQTVDAKVKTESAGATKTTSPAQTASNIKHKSY